MRRYLPLVVIAVAGFLLFSGWREIRLAESRAAVIAADVDARWAQALLVRSRRLYSEAIRSADSIQADAATRVARADAKLAVSRQALASFVASIESAPDTCKPDLAKAAGLIGEAQDVAMEYRKGYEKEHKAAQTLRGALDSTAAALAVADTALSRLRAASMKLVAATRPSLFQRLIPRAGFGGAIGVDPRTLQPSATIGVTLSW